MSMQETNVRRIAPAPSSRWISEDVKPGPLGTKLPAVISKVRPMFIEWMTAQQQIEKNTVILAVAVKKAYDLYSQGVNDGRVGFARLFDTTIAADAKTRDLSDNPVYNRLNYLLDKVAKVSTGSSDTITTTRATVEEKREKVQEKWVAFRKAHKGKSISLADVEGLVTRILSDIWPEKVVEDVLAA
jgi:hypothetical protein